MSHGRCGRENSNRAAEAPCGRGRCEAPAIFRATPRIASNCDFLVAGEAKNPAISAAEWLRTHLRPPWSLRFCDAIFVPLRQGMAARSRNVGLGHPGIGCAHGAIRKS